MNGKKLDSNTRSSQSLTFFKKRILAFKRHSANSTFHYHNPTRLKLIRRLRPGLNHLIFHESKDSSQDTLDPTGNHANVETTIYLLSF